MKFPRVTFLTHEISMAAQPVRIPERRQSPEARLRSVLFDAADRLCAFPDPVELRVLVPAIREAYEDSRLDLPLLKIQIHNMLLDLQTPGGFDATYYANHLSQVAVRL